jgi:hypothetical protein
MNDSKLVELFHTQLSSFEALLEAEKIVADDSALPSDALSFAEFLLLCPTEDAAKLQMQRDHKGATGFLSIVYSLETEWPKIGISIVAETPTHAAPFFVLASFVQEYLEKMKQQSSDDWI